MGYIMIRATAHQADTPTTAYEQVVYNSIRFHSYFHPIGDLLLFHLSYHNNYGSHTKSIQVC